MALGIRHSLRARLLGLLLLAILLTALAQAFVVYREARAEADSIFDYHMQQMAQALRTGVSMPDLPALDEELTTDKGFDFLVQVWSNDGLSVFQSRAGAALPQRAVLGFSEVRVRNIPYRVFSMQTRSQVIQVAQDMGPRRAMARSLAWRTITPILWMAPLLMLVAWWAVSASLRPVERVRAQVASREADELSSVAEQGLPDEIRPLVHELNLLFDRVRNAFEAQQHFVSDAAHELRSPLAALRLQVQGLQRARDDESRQVALDRLLSGIDRATRLVEQLLMLARQEAGMATGSPPQAVVLSDLVRMGMAEANPLAQLKHIDLGLCDADDSLLLGQPEALRILLRNLLDNAIKYTPEGGQVDVSVRREGSLLMLSVDDSGPGIPDAERSRVFDRFYRIQGAVAGGSGLGLAIVNAIARAHGAQLALAQAASLGGLRVELRFPVHG
ncbi:two-component sensor histidine kinase [Hydrogenophaga crassostreae]|uniref:histidine kinase n=1 Tax=Hydrogenophaga crassostreae TaxID=1763535 RepID=A0A167IPJ2_9BURK|nr:ATP-binding protein [Hydrogenophaga crassostreae]AOW14610.1 two-component sensor histidine kinase [Hydrogenophaga crassostreae]OAD43293.1 two-component sensor histidine kinase [Hydrogenophaga crassostreae]